MFSLFADFQNKEIRIHSRNLLQTFHTVSDLNNMAIWIIVIHMMLKQSPIPSMKVMIFKLNVSSITAKEKI
jgi:hypothetical protein